MGMAQEGCTFCELSVGGMRAITFANGFVSATILPEKEGRLLLARMQASRLSFSNRAKWGRSILRAERACGTGRHKPDVAARISQRHAS